MRCDQRNLILEEEGTVTRPEARCLLYKTEAAIRQAVPRRAFFLKRKEKRDTPDTFANFSKYPLNTANSMRELQCRFKSHSY